MTKYLIFGSAGFVGFNLKIELERFVGNEVIGFDRRDPKKPRDILINKQELYDEVENADIVFHLAAIPAHRLSVRNPEEILQNNIECTLTIAEACRLHNKPMVYASSFSVYGNQPPSWTEDMPMSAETPYSLSKVICEQILQFYHKFYGLDVKIARFSNVYGPFEEFHDPMQVIPTWLNQAKKGEKITVYGENTTRDFTYVFDICYGLMSISRTPGFDIYNLCSGKEVKLLDIAKQITSNIQVLPLPSYETERWVGDNSKITKMGWQNTNNIDGWIWCEKLRRGIK